MVTVPALRLAPARGVSIRDCVLTGASWDHPRSVQYAVNWSNLVTSQSTTHLVAETKP